MENIDQETISPGNRRGNSSAKEFTLRDEANALTAYAFRNGFIEELHAGKMSPLLQDSEYSRITNDEMRRLMIESSIKIEEALRLKASNPEMYEVFIRECRDNYCAEWLRN
jgi:hypothetical protein